MQIVVLPMVMAVLPAIDPQLTRRRHGLAGRIYDFSEEIGNLRATTRAFPRVFPRGLEHDAITAAEERIALLLVAGVSLRGERDCCRRPIGRNRDRTLGQVYLCID
jgi:hypothetical protein